MAKRPARTTAGRRRKALGRMADEVLTQDNDVGLGLSRLSDAGDIRLTMPMDEGGPASDTSDEPAVDVMLPSDVGIPFETDEPDVTETEMEDGSVIIDLDPRAEPMDIPHDANLAEYLPESELQRISNDLLDGIDADDASRKQWLADRERGLELLGLKLEDPAISDSSAMSDGMSRVRHPLLLDAILRFQANARAELLPAHGPVKIVSEGYDTSLNDDLASKLETMLNYYLTNTASEYYPDTNRMLFEVGFSGVAFKKVYRCPLRRRPVSEFILGKDLVVSNLTTDLDNAARVTHRLTMRPSVLKRMQLLGVYLDIDVGSPEYAEGDEIKKKVYSIQGVTPSNRPEDQEHQIEECYCELDIEGFEHRDDQGQITGLPIPYRVTIERHSRKILEIRRNWSEFDPDYKRQLKIVKYSFADGFGFYSIGLLHMLGNSTVAATASWRMLLDAGTLSNFQGGFRTKKFGRQKDNNLRINFGEFVPVDVPEGTDIRTQIMTLPFKEPSQTLMGLNDNIVQTGARLAGSADLPTGEGKDNAPVGTTLALLEGQTKVMSAVHKNLHMAQKREFELLLDEFKSDPEALWKSNRANARYFDLESLLKALENVALVPYSDPNVPSQMHRMAKMQAMFQIANAAPMLFNLVEVAAEMLKEIGFEDAERFFAPPTPPQPDPMQVALQLEAQTKQQQTMIKGAELQLKAQKQQFDIANEKSKRDLERDKAVIDLAQTLARYPESDPIVDEQIRQMSPLMGTPMVMAQMRSLGMPRQPRRRPAPRPNGLGAAPMLPGFGTA